MRKWRERVPCRLFQKRKKLGQQMILLFLAPSHMNLDLDSLLLLSWRKVRCKTRVMMIEKQVRIGRETERFHKNLRLQRTRTRWR